MYSNNSNGSRAAWARGFMALFAIVLAMGLGAMASPAEAAPFAYVANGDSDAGPGAVSVIDTVTNTVVATVGVGFLPHAVAVTPDGKHAYVTNSNRNPFVNGTVSVIRTATNKVVATVPVGLNPMGVAITPDGNHAYVVEYGSNTVSVIATATNTVVGPPIPVGLQPYAVAFTPDGTHAYVTSLASNHLSVIDTATNTVVAKARVGGASAGVAVTPDGTQVYVANNEPYPYNVSVIATATNTVVATVPLGGSRPVGVAITPEGKHVYVAYSGSNNVSVIRTATNKVVAMIPGGSGPGSVAITPDGKQAYVANVSTVLVIDTATKIVVATVGVGGQPNAVGIVPPPPGVPFLAFSATALDIAFGAAPNEDSFNLHSSFTLSSTASGLHPHRDTVTLQVGTFSITIPPGSFREQPDGSFAFAGVISGVSLTAQIYPTGTLQYAFHVKATGASLTFTTNPVYVTLSISGDSGATSVTAQISGAVSVKARISR